MPSVPRVCPLCGPKLALFCMVMSAWGIIFLGLLGVFFYFETGILFADISPGKVLDPMRETKKFVVEVSDKYRSCAVNCWIAAALYVVTLVGAVWQNKWNASNPLS